MTHSRGTGQIKMSADNKEMQALYDKYGITYDNIIHPENSAAAVMLRLLHMYNSEIRGRKFEVKKEYLENKGLSLNSNTYSYDPKTDKVYLDPYIALIYKYKGGV
jgi:hypothetical protein